MYCIVLYCIVLLLDHLFQTQCNAIRYDANANANANALQSLVGLKPLRVQVRCDGAGAEAQAGDH